ncbi:MAG: hypothetical protein JSV62_09740 [Promethearchaeota archaeon]|nr:MAG: hypothetical protein JSV62_09740 [Candidatus Lokiarchaeota archaeon]
MEFFYWFVWIVGILIFIVVSTLYGTKKIDKFIWYLFWLGVILGLSWEIALTIANLFSPFPPARFIIPPPLPFPYSSVMIIITHSFWDGGLFLLGVWFIQLICKKPVLEKNKISELLVFIVYGQISTLIVELLSTSSGGWEYYVYVWNPLLFSFFGHNITLLPQLIWVLAPITFYSIAVKLKQRISPK